MVVELLKQRALINHERLDLLKQVIPEAFADGKINWETLKDLLEGHLEDEEAEHFGLTWPGKRKARRLASLPSQGTLVPVLGEGVSEDTTNNIFIEGDNLEALKLLQKSYAGRVKLICIDPPYNTGQSFIYKDNFQEPLEDYLRRTQQVEDSGELLTTNPKSSGRFHSSWMNMMYPRLRLARNLLRDDGVIFISIDDNEVSNLRLILNEIFGDENFIGCLCWQKKYSPANDTVDFSANHDFILIYGKQRLISESGKPLPVINRLERTEKQNRAYKNPDNDPRGLWKAGDYLCNKTAEQRPNLYYPIVHPKTGKEVLPSKTSVWRYSRERHKQNISDNRVWWGLNQENTVPAYKRFLTDVGAIVADTWWTHEDAGHTDEAKKQIKVLFPEASQVFDTPKPTRLIQRIVSLSTNLEDEDIVLDFFAGSCTTGHAVLEQNRADGGNRRFILVQLPEGTNDLQLPTVSEIGKERLRREINKFKNADKGKLNLQAQLDYGFKVYKLSRSSFRHWKDYERDDIQGLQITFLNFENPLIDNWNEQDVVTEILLAEGFPLDSKVAHQTYFRSNKVLVVESDFIEYKLFICLDDKIADETIQELQLPEKEDMFVCLDSALTDKAKMQLADNCNVKII